MTSKKTPEVSVVDQMADDATPDEYPEGAPLLKPVRLIRPFSLRGEFKRKMAQFEPIKDKVSALQESGVFDPEAEHVTESDRINAAADMDEMLQYIDELLTMAAVNRKAYQEWQEGLEDDNDLIRVFNVYMNRSQPGEASSSTS